MVSGGVTEEVHDVEKRVGGYVSERFSRLLSKLLKRSSLSWLVGK